MKQPPFTRYWLGVGAIALVGGFATAISSFVVWRSQRAAIAVADEAIGGQILLMSTFTSLVLTIGAAIVLKQQLSQEQRFRRIFEAAAIGIGLDSLNGKILESNPALQSMLGYSRAELASMTFSEFTHPDDRVADVDLFNEMIAGTREAYQVEKRHLRKDGKPLWVRITNSLVRNREGAPQYTIAVAEDITQLRQAQECVQLYGDIVKRMQIGLLVWQLPDLADLTSFRLVECNPAAWQILQVNTPIAQILGKPMVEVFPDLIDTAFPKIYADVIRSGAVRDLGEVRFGDRTIPDGVFATKAFPLPNQCVGLIFEDITERKQAEDALQQSEARFRVVAETASCAFLIYQGNHLRYVNPAAEEITGYSRDELMTVNFWDLAHPDFRGLVRDRGLARQRGENVPRRYEIKILTKAGTERWVDMTAGSVYLNGQPAAIATAYDITDRKEAEAQLQMAADRERLLSEMALRIRSSLNLEEILNTTVAEVRRFLQADRVFIAQLACGSPCQTVAESVDPNWSSILGWETDTHAVEEIRQLFKQNCVRVVNDTAQVEKTPFLKEYHDRCQVRAGMGVPIMLEGDMFGVLIVNQCGEPRQWQPFEVDLLQKLGTQVEIAIQQGQLYQQLRILATNLECQVEERTLELRQRMQELQSLNQVKDILLHAVSHDLRTPVQGMLMVLNHLRHKGDETITIPCSMLKCMIDSSDRQLSLLDSLMENHAAIPCKKTLNYESVQFDRVVETALAALDTQLQSSQATIVNHISPNLLPLTADPMALQYVLEQLILNATTHNPPGRTITIDAVVLPPDADHTTRYFYCSVTDNGVGIDPAKHDRLFQLYVRGIDNQRLTGIGLGLHRCHKIISIHGGAIGVDSQLDRGSRFWFTLPIEVGNR